MMPQDSMNPFQQIMQATGYGQPNLQGMPQPNPISYNTNPLAMLQHANPNAQMPPQQPQFQQLKQPQMQMPQQAMSMQGGAAPQQAAMPSAQMPQGMGMQLPQTPQQASAPVGGGMPSAQASPLPQGQQRYTPQQLAALGRNGDNTIAHLTPGEMTVPPELQSPKVLATLQKEYAKKGVSASDFTVGSPNAKINPATGLPEFNFWDSFLPIALSVAGGVGGSLIAPGIGTAIGAGLGTTAGDLATGKDVQSSLMAGGLSGLGSYAGGALLGKAAAGTTDAAANQALTNTAVSSSGVNPEGFAVPTLQDAGINTAGQSATQAAASTPSSSGFLSGMLPNGMNSGNVIGGAAGGALGNTMFGTNTATQTPQYPPGFMTPMTPVSQLGSYQSQLGQGSGNGLNPNFTGYNPFTLSPSSYNFFPQQTGVSTATS